MNGRMDKMLIYAVELFVLCSKEEVEQKKNEEAVAARKRKVAEIQRKYFHATKRTSADDLAPTKSSTSNEENSGLQKRQQRGRINSKEELEKLLCNLSDTPEKECPKNTRTDASGKQSDIKLLPNLPCSKETLEQLLWNMSDTPEKQELAKKKRTVAAAKRQLDLKLQPANVRQSTFYRDSRSSSVGHV